MESLQMEKSVLRANNEAAKENLLQALYIIWSDRYRYILRELWLGGILKIWKWPRPVQQLALTKYSSVPLPPGCLALEYLRCFFTPAEFSAFKSNSGLFFHLKWFICTGVNTITAVGCGQKQPHPLDELQRGAFMVWMWSNSGPQKNNLVYITGVR